MDSVETTQLIFALHAHQPVGNFKKVFEQITNESYLPFLRTFREHSCGPISYHASGILYNWWMNNRPEVIDLIGELIEAGRLEPLVGGFYEPILSLIPRDDRRRQLEKHRRFIEDTFSVCPRGAWLTERIWSPELPADLREAGIEYTTVDDFHFQAAGWDIDRLSGYYQTEYDGESLSIFPISKQLRYKVPFAEVKTISEFINQQSGRGLTMADDAEKFGSWPETDKWVYEDGWLKRFFAAADRGEINLVSLGDYYDSNPASGGCYLPTTSYQEMQEWVLPPDKKREYEQVKEKLNESEQQYLRGGHFQHFLVKYPESNRMHKMSLWLSKHLDPENNPEAYDHLLKAQCNDSYWHGIFGGLALPHLRSSNWFNLAQALKKSDIPDLPPQEVDFKHTGRNEIIVSNDNNFLVCSPANGGSLEAWILFPAARNVLDTLTRSWEAYLEEEKPTSDEDASVDTIHHQHVKVPSAWLQEWHEDSVSRAGFQPLQLPKGQPVEQSVYFMENQQPSRVNCEQNKFELFYPNQGLAVNYELYDNKLSWRADYRSDCRWGTELTFGFRSPKESDCQLKIEGQALPVTERLSRHINSLQLIDRPAEIEITLELPEKVELIAYPINSITRSEADAEKIYQGTALIFLTHSNNLVLNCEWTDMNQ